MNLSFDPSEDDDILNTTIRDSYTGSVMYIVETPRYAGGTLTTTVTRRNQNDGTTKVAFKILWKSGKGLLKDVSVVLDDRTSQEVPIREVLENASGSSTYGSVRIGDVEYRWKSKGTGSKMVLVTKDNKTTAAKSHRRIRHSFFRKPRDMALDISEVVAFAVDIILLTFMLVWRERENERAKPTNALYPHAGGPALSPLPGDD